MKRLLLSGTAALLLTRGTAHAQTELERQTGIEMLKEAFRTHRFFDSGGRWLGWKAPGTERGPMRQEHHIVSLPPIYDPWVLPPVEYDYEFTGQIEVFRVDEEGLKSECRIGLPGGANTHTACAHRYGTRYCAMIIAYDDILNRYRISYDATFRHERAHCNGWHHADESFGVK